MPYTWSLALLFSHFPIICIMLNRSYNAHQHYVSAYLYIIGKKCIIYKGTKTVLCHAFLLCLPALLFCSSSSFFVCPVEEFCFLSITFAEIKPHTQKPTLITFYIHSFNERSKTFNFFKCCCP